MKPSTRQPDAARRIASSCLAGRTRLINREITAIFEAALRPLKLRVSQLNVLVMIANRGPITAGVIGRFLHIEKSTMSRNVERLAARGWIRTQAADDNRAQLLSLTARGRRIVEQALPYWEEAQRQVTKRLGTQNVEAIVRIASVVTAGASEAEPDG